MKYTRVSSAAFLTIIFFFTLVLPGYSQPGKRGVQKFQMKRPAISAVTSSAKKAATLEPGSGEAIIFVGEKHFDARGEVAIIFVGRDLLPKIISAQVLYKGRPVKEITARVGRVRTLKAGIGPKSARGRRIVVKAGPGAKPANYQLRLIVLEDRKKKAVTVPLNVMRIAVKKVTPQIIVGPRELEAGPKRMLSRELMLALRDAKRLTSREFNNIVSEAFSRSTFNANACGGSYTYRKTTLNIPNLLFNEEPLDRLDYELTDGEKERTEWTIHEEIGPDLIGRRSKMRACVDDWRTAPWTGGIEDGKFKVYLSFGDEAITTRAIEQRKTNIPISFWRDMWDWRAVSADNAIQDYEFKGLVSEVVLTPRLDNGTITYSTVEVYWVHRFDGFVLPGKFRLAALQTKIENYKNGKLETIRQRIRGVFNKPEVRAKLSQAVTEFVLSNSVVNTVVGITPNGPNIEVAYE